MDQVKQMQSSFVGLPTRAKRIIYVVAALTVVMIAFVLHSASKTSWTTVDTGIRTENMANVEAALGTAKIDDKVGADGTSVMVTSSNAPAARLALATAGVLTGNSGGGAPDPYKMFGTPSKYGMTTDQQKIFTQQLAEQKIQNDVNGLQGIDGSQVNLVTPDASPFSDDSSKPSAAVTVNTGGQGVTQQQVKAIAQLTAYSVAGLKPTDVNVTDDLGNSFTGGSTSGAGSGASADVTKAQAKLALENSYDAAVKARLGELLTPMVGANHFVIAANANIDVDQVATETKTFGGATNAQGPMNEEQSQTEKLAGDPSAVPAGVAGTGSNTTNPTGTATTPNSYSSPTGTGTGTNYANLIKDAKFDNDQFRQMVTSAPGNAVSQNISVIVDKGSAKGKDALSSGDEAAITKAINTFAAKSGDKPTIQFATLKSASAKPASAPLSSKLNLKNYSWLLAALGLMAFAFFVRRQLNQRTYELLSAPSEPLLLGPGNTLEPVPLRELEAAVAAAGTLDSQKRQELQRKVEQIASNKPDDVAVQLRGWLHEDRR